MELLQQNMLQYLLRVGNEIISLGVDYVPGNIESPQNISNEMSQVTE